jgi:hypothetical protein
LSLGNENKEDDMAGTFSTIFNPTDTDAAPADDTTSQFQPIGGDQPPPPPEIASGGDGGDFAG